jgi:hypothetical protein
MVEVKMNKGISYIYQTLDNVGDLTQWYLGQMVLQIV